jgi:hypothetical protein
MKKKTILTFLICFIAILTFAQSQKKVTIWLSTQFNKTIADRTIGNNPWGIGLGLQTYFNNKSKFKPTIELTGDIYLESDKIGLVNTDGSLADDVRGMVNLFFGSSYHPSNCMYVSLVVGSSFINGQTLAGLKPSFGFYFSESHRWIGKISYIHIFDRDKATKEDFSSLSFAVGLKLF